MKTSDFLKKPELELIEAFDLKGYTMYPEFTYNEMCLRRTHSSEEAGYSYSSGPSGFMTMYARDTSNFPNIRQKVGWKFHVSLNQDQANDGTNLAKGWDIVNEVLRTHHCPEWKIIASPSANVGASKQITIYACKDHKSSDEWQPILQAIEEQLTEAKIKPDPAGFCDTDRRIPGSRFIAYRNDSSPQGHYLPESHAISYNDSGQTDPYDTLALVPPDNSSKCCILI
ncbi:MAG: hypothetical protein AB7F64_01330 [Gammaproteobacteria bacterium]